MPAKRTTNQKHSTQSTIAARGQARSDRGRPEAIGAIVARMFSGPVQKIRGGDLGDYVPAPSNDAREGADAVAVQDRQKRPASR